MVIEITCPGCGELLAFPDEDREHTIRCPVCRNTFTPSETQQAERKTESQRLAKPSTGSWWDSIPSVEPGKEQLVSAIGRMKRREADAQADLRRASKVQLKLLPNRLPASPDLDMNIHYKAAKEVGGDYYDFISIDHENLGIVVADVSGKGIPAGITMAMTRMALRLLARGSPSARDTMIEVNRHIAGDINGVMFVTVLYMVLNISTHALRVVNCGHNPLILWRERKYRLVNPAGIAVGIDPGPIFKRTIKEDLILLQPGDRIVAYTDGVVESMNERREPFGEKEFLEIVTQHGHKSSAQFLETLVDALDKHQGSATQHDDITVVTFKYR